MEKIIDGAAGAPHGYQTMIKKLHESGGSSNMMVRTSTVVADSLG
ncbi:hypothetical protein AB0J51_21095 [Micromonospora echinofusca]